MTLRALATAGECEFLGQLILPEIPPEPAPFLPSDHHPIVKLDPPLVWGLLQAGSPAAVCVLG